MDKKRTRIMIDITMTVLLPLLMAYSLIGETLHEVLGTVIFILFIVHHIMNRKWYHALSKGKHDAQRLFQIILDFMILVFMFAQPISGILISKHLYTFLPTMAMSADARMIHLVLAYWGYVLLCIHAGTHLMVPMKKLIQKSKKAGAGLWAVLGCISVYGIAAFIKRGFLGYMSGTTAFAFFDFTEPRIYFFLDYLTIMVLCMTVGCLIVFGLHSVRK